MLNKNILKERLIEKFNTIGLHEIANECFIKALPYDEADLAPVKRDLHKYSGAVMESLGGFSILTNAMANEKDPMKKSLLTKIYNICNTSACEAADRVMDQVTPDKKLDEVVDSAQFTEEEIRGFIKKSGDLSVDDIAKAVQQKTLQIIKEEQEAYQKADDLKQELNDAVTDNPVLSEDATMESYLNIVLSRGDKREHSSFFSKLQDTAMEALLHTKEDYIELPIDTMVGMTKGGLFTGNNTLNLQTAIEAYKLLNGEAKEPTDTSRLADTATLTAVVMYTALEAFHTLNLYSPSQKEIQKLTEKPDWFWGVQNESLTTILNEAHSTIAANRTKCMTTNDVGTLQNISQEMKSCMEAFAEFSEEEKLSKIASSAEAVANAATAKLSAMNTEAPTLPGYLQRQKEENVANVNRIARYYVNNPDISEIHILLPKASSNPDIARDNETGTVAMEIRCTNLKKEPVTESFLMVHNHPDFKMSLEQVLIEAIDNSKLAGNSSVKVTRKTM